MRALYKQGQYPARLPTGLESDRFRRGNLGVALTDDLGPAADDRALDEAEALERHPADLADEIAGGARTSAALSIVRQFPLRGIGLLLRHFDMVMP